jgi:hypothetical protein
MIWKYLRALALILLIGSWHRMEAQERCPQLSRLRGEATEAAKKTIGSATPDR